MQKIELRVPPLTHLRIVLTKWLVNEGMKVEADSAVCEFVFESYFGNKVAKATFEFPASSSGTVHQTFEGGSEVKVNDLFGWLEKETE